MTLQLLPMPRHLTIGDEAFTLHSGDYISLSLPDEMLFSGKRIQMAIYQKTGLYLNIAGGDLPASISLRLDEKISQDEGYKLTITGDGIHIVGHDFAGVFYGACTLVQLIETHGSTLPLLEIEDYPDFPNRGVMLDVSRDKVPTIDTLLGLIDMLASWKINQVQLYIEHTFGYRNHRVVWEKSSPFTAHDILEIDAYCRERHIDLVPNQNSFGHMHRWFEHEPYKHLAETETAVSTPWGTTHKPFSLSPAVPETLTLLDELFAEYLPNFSSDYFNVGCDETFDLGMGRSKALVEEKGKGRVYLDYLLEIYKRVKSHGRTMMFWGDIINQYPDLVPEVPNDVIALEWGYEATHDFPTKSKLFADSGIPFYVCPGTSSWVSISGRTDNCIGNIRNAVENGLKHGAIGVLNTDWGDYGHWQTLPISYLGFAYGAALSWSYENNVEMDVPKILDTFVFKDATGIMGKLAYDLGNVYQKPGFIVPNGNLLFWMFQAPFETFKLRMERIVEFAKEHMGLQLNNPRELIDNPEKLAQNLSDTLPLIDEIIAPLESAAMIRDDAALIKREFRLAAQMLKHGAKHGIAQLTPGKPDHKALKDELEAIERDFREIWLERNRPGGLEDSVTHFQLAYDTYSS